MAPDITRHITGLAFRIPGMNRILPFLHNAPFRLTTLLSILTAWGVIRGANRVLNVIAANAWRVQPAPGWTWPKEVAVVTGGSGGIGKHIVEKLVNHGIRVAVLDIQDLPKSLEDEPLVHFYQCDVSNPEAVATTADVVRKDLGHPSILINNAGVVRFRPILQIPTAHVQRLFSINCVALWLTTKQFLPHMIESNKGHVVTIASLASFIALPAAADYAASKAGAHAFHEALTCELKHIYKAPNVLTTIIHPDFVKTSFIDDVAELVQQNGIQLLDCDKVADKIVAQVLSRRGGQLVLPENETYIAGIRAWPTWLQELTRDAYGRVIAQLKY
ncbi:hypothetical protein S7711_03826 [Stachybotrys chartarum IBT 7711]|uniref:Short-chain dehydrogenase/reductase 3 n=1 Tax=Stachybotrys chartarum (strain CBS 109288 / IBT 7711) TaxID=1280523 RepID=A0A084AUB5_STACB|nr:hypothetical protein S7711_03826 [Stachybotrys chartarum IBT 7711]